jgi:uncharacterized membrane protein
MNDTRRLRLENFSDAVMAIAITLLALELTVPHIQSHDIIGSARELISLIPVVLTFVLSFGTIAIFWVNHHQLTQHMTHMKRRITWANMLFLMFQAMIPFGTIAAAENYANPLAVMTYSLVLFGASLSFSILRHFIHPKRSLSPQSAIRSYVGPIVYLLAILVAPITVWASYAFLVLPPLYYFLPRKGVSEN